MKKEISIKCPETPNFLHTEFDVIPIAEFSDNELREIGKEWTEELIKKAASKRPSK